MSKVYTIVVKGQRIDFTQADLNTIKKGEVHTDTQKKIVHVFTGKGRVDVDKKEFDATIRKGLLSQMSPEELESLEAALTPGQKQELAQVAEEVVEVQPQEGQDVVPQGQAEHPGEQMATSNAGDPQERKPEEPGPVNFDGTGDEVDLDIDEENPEYATQEEEEAELTGEEPDELLEEPGVPGEDLPGEPGELGAPEEGLPGETGVVPGEPGQEAQPLQVVCPHCKGQVDVNTPPGGVVAPNPMDQAPMAPQESQVPGPLRKPGEPIKPTFGTKEQR